MSASLNWKSYGGERDEPGHAVLMAECYSKNGTYGCCFIVRTTRAEKGYILEAGSNDTGNMWKSPDTVYETIEEAKAAAEKLWRPV